MIKIGRKFKAKEKLEILMKWKTLGWGVANAKKVARIYNCSVQSMYIWKGRYDGTLESLKNGDQTPHYIWNKYSEEELNEVKEMSENYTGIGRMELYGRLQVERGYSKSIRTLYRMLNKINVAPLHDIAKHIAQPYNTPLMIGVKWQIDVKFVPTCCLMNISNSAFYERTGKRFYQYTCIDEASRKRFTYAYGTYGKRETVDFAMRCFVFFGYLPMIIQTDNGGEFTNCFATEKRPQKALHEFPAFLAKLGITHQLIRPATPRHNGKVERSHRTDNQEFYYNHQGKNGFKSLDDLREKMKDWLFRYNNIRVMSALKYKTPSAVEAELMQKLRAEQGKVSYIELKEEKEGVVKLIKQNLDWAFKERPIQTIA